MKTTTRTFKVEKSELTEMGNYLNKLIHTRTVNVESPIGSIFGLSKEVYYRFTDTQLTIGSEVTLDLSEYHIVEKPHKIVYEDTGEVIEVTFKYLYPKGEK